MTATSGGRKLYRRVVFSNLNTSSANVRFSLNPSPGRHGRRALELLAASRDGATDAILVAHGFSIEQIVDLVRAGLATAKAERTVAGGKTIEVARARITQEGRWAL